MHRLSEETSERVTANVVFASHRQTDAPNAVFLVSRDEAEVEGLAQRLGIRYEHHAADRLSRVLPALDTYLAIAEVAPAPTGYEVQRFAAGNLRWHSTAADVQPGLYAYLVHGLTKYRFVQDRGHNYEVDRAVGIYSELRRTAKGVLSWHADDINGTLIVPGQAPLPTLQARVATACSGLAAKFVRADATLRYVNVPLDVANRLAGSLGQSLRMAAMENGIASNA